MTVSFRRAAGIFDPPSDCPPLALPLLITGVAGVPGYNALPYFCRRYPGQVVGLRQEDNWRLTGDAIVGCDLEDRDELARLFEQHQFRSVLNAAGVCALKSCELNHALAYRVNVEGLANLLDVIEGRDVRLVHLSVDLVFSGTQQGDHVELDPVDPVTMYGKTMVVAEQLLFSRQPEAACLRISLPMGESSNNHAGAIDWIKSRFKKSRPATLFYDELRTPTYTDCLNEVYEAVLARPDIQGLFHAGAPRKLTLHQIGQIINRVGGYDPELLHGCLRHEAGPIPPRAGDVTMDSSKLAAALGYQPFHPWPYDDRFVPTHREWHFDRTPDWQGSRQLLGEILHRNPLRRAAS